MQFFGGLQRKAIIGDAPWEGRQQFPFLFSTTKLSAQLTEQRFFFRGKRQNAQAPYRKRFLRITTLWGGKFSGHLFCRII